MPRNTKRADEQQNLDTQPVQSDAPKSELRPPRRIIFTGEGEPHTGETQIGMTKFILPDNATQRAGFAHEHAILIYRSLPGYELEKKAKQKGN